MSYVYLVAAILLEVCGTTCMKLSQGFTRPAPSVLLFVFYAASFSSLTFALKQLDVSVAYAIWSGLGTAIIAAIGVAWFGEVLTPARVLWLALIIVGVIGLHLSGAAHG